MQSLPPLHDENNSIIQNIIPEEMKWKQPLPFTDLFSRRFDLNDFELAGLLAHLLFETFPPRMVGAVACGQKVFKGLQLRVQLRYRTGFPFQTLPEQGSWSPRHDKSRKIIRDSLN